MKRLRGLLYVVGLVAFPATASAHAVGIEAKLKGETLHVEGFFDDNTPASDATVTVTAEDGRIVCEGKTDAKGFWDVPVPPGGKYTISLNAGAGHLTKTVLDIPPRANHPSKASSEVVVSEGLNRNEFTGPRRLLMTAIGLGIIGGLTWLGWRLTRKRAAT